MINQENYNNNEESESRYLSFFIDSQLYGVSTADVVQIVGMQEITKLPDTPSYVKGVINLRGEIFPVIDVRQRLNCEEVSYTERTCIIITKINDSSFGFVVDEVDEVLDIDKDQITSPPKINNETTGGEYLIGIGKLLDSNNERAKLILIMELSQFLSEKEFSALTSASYRNN